jgi:hypothetical protein
VASLLFAENLKIRNPKHLPARSRFGEGRRNPKWFDQPFGNLRVLSNVEGQYLMIQIQNLQEDRRKKCAGNLRTDSWRA